MSVGQVHFRSEWLPDVDANLLPGGGVGTGGGSGDASGGGFSLGAWLKRLVMGWLRPQVYTEFAGKTLEWAPEGRPGPSKWVFLLVGLSVFFAVWVGLTVVGLVYIWKNRKK